MEHFNSLVEAEGSPLSSQTVGAAGKNGIEPNITMLQEIMIASFAFSILGVIGHAIVLWFLFCKIRIKLCLYFVCLTVANIILSFCNIVSCANFLMKVKFGLIFQRVLRVLGLAIYDTGFYFCTAIAAERWFSLYFPVWYHQNRPNYFSAVICSFLWGFSWLVSFLEYYICFPRRQVYFHSVDSCQFADVTEIITQFIFLPSTLCFTLGIWIKMKQEGPPVAKLDITIVAMVLVFLILHAPLRLAKLFIYWDSSKKWHMLINICFLLDSVYSTSLLLIYLIVGFWNRQKQKEPYYMFLKRALSGMENIRTSTSEEQT